MSVVQFHVTWIVAADHGIRIDHDFTVPSLTVFFGMDPLFILSGFLILDRLDPPPLAPEDGHAEPEALYIRRVSRTFPAYYVVLTYLALTTALTATQIRHLPWE